MTSCQSSPYRESMYEVVLPIPVGDSFWRRGGGSDLLESQQGRTSDGRWFISSHPRDHLIEWLREFTSSWAYYHEFDPPRGLEHIFRLHPTGVVFGFREASDAVLFKLTWGGV